MTAADTAIRPFRWNLKHREQLGSMADAPLPATFFGFDEELLDCAARTVAQCHDGDLVFVGRSPEHLFDLLSGVFEGTSWEDRIDMFHISIRFWDMDDLHRKLPCQASDEVAVMLGSE